MASSAATALAKKLQLKPGQRLRVINGGDGRIEALASALGDDSLLDTTGDAVLVFVLTLEEAARFAPEAFALGRDALVWLAYPKGGSGVITDVNRDRLWKALEGTGWRPVRQVALDATWSAMRFRPADLVA
ncbi:MAG: hypothetical protein U0360_01535 [Dehalococcoidia bacterium]